MGEDVAGAALGRATTLVAPTWDRPELPSLAEQARLERLKAGLLTAGLRITPAARHRLEAIMGDTVTVHEYATTGGLTMDLGHGVLANSPVDEWFCDETIFELHEADGDLAIVDRAGDAHPISTLIPLPGYLDTNDHDGRLATDTAFSHADRVRLSPIVGCAYKCDYCDLPAERYARRPVDQLQASLEIALVDHALPPRHVMVSGGSPGSRHVEWFVDTILELVAGCPLPLDVMMSAIPDRTDVVDRLVDGGVSGFSLNLELYEEDASLLHIRGKHRHARPGWDAFVARAVERLGRDGSVRSLIIGGLEESQSTLAGVRQIAAHGADPVISPFRPAERTSLADRRPPPATEMLDLLGAAREIAADAGVQLGPRCIPCQHNTLTFPWDVRAD